MRRVPTVTASSWPCPPPVLAARHLACEYNLGGQHTHGAGAPPGAQRPVYGGAPPPLPQPPSAALPGAPPPGGAPADIRRECRECRECRRWTSMQTLEGSLASGYVDTRRYRRWWVKTTQKGAQAVDLLQAFLAALLPHSRGGRRQAAKGPHGVSPAATYVRARARHRGALHTNQGFLAD